MTRRSVLASVLALVASLVVIAPDVSPASTGDLSADDICELYPQDEGFEFSANPGNRSCVADRGDCDQSSVEIHTCVSGVVIQHPSAGEARDAIPAAGEDLWRASSGIGEVGVEACGAFWCEVRFARDRFWVSVLAAPDLGIDAARAVAGHVDAQILELAGAAPEEPEPEDPGPAPQPEDPGPAPQPEDPGDAPEPSDIYVDVFFGSGGILDLYPDISRFMGCEEFLLDCPGASESKRNSVALLDQFNAGPPPTQRQSAGFQALFTAEVLAGLRAEDGSPLFPSVVAAMPLIRKLSDPAVAQRFVEMIAAQDVAHWEDRW